MNCIFLEFYSEYFQTMIDLRSLKLCKVCFFWNSLLFGIIIANRKLGTLIIQSSWFSTLSVRLFSSPQPSLWDLWMNWWNRALRCAGQAPPHWATPSAFAFLVHTSNKCLPVSFLLSSVSSLAFLSEDTLSPAVTWACLDNGQRLVHTWTNVCPPPIMLHHPDKGLNLWKCVPSQLNSFLL